MIRPAPETARRIDRLSYRAHLFHRFAHHPLCAAYASEVIRVGRRGRVCQGCSLMGLGLLAGAFAGGIFRLSLGATVAIGIGGVAVAASSFAWRTSKISSRLLPAVATGIVCASALCAWSIGALAAAASTLAAFAVMYGAYRRRGPHRGPCAACPERGAPSPCVGLQEIVQRERAFRRLAGRLIAHGPPSITEPCSPR
jgi:MFS family permease